MRAGRMVTSYVIEEDKNGVYLVTPSLVIVRNGHLAVEKDHFPLIARVDKTPNPFSLTLMDDQNEYIFVRASGWSNTAQSNR